MAASHQLEGGMRATACVLAPRQQQQQQANKLEASKIKITKTQEKQLWCEDAGLRSQVFLQEMQQSHLIMLSRLTAANAVSLVWVDLELVWLPCSDQLGHQEICVEKVHVLIQEAMEDQQAVRLIGQLLHMQGYRPCLVSLLIVFRDIHVSFRVPCVIGHPHSDRSTRNGYLEYLWLVDKPHE